MKWTLILIVLIFLGIFYAYFPKTLLPNPLTPLAVLLPAPTPSPFPFEQMTIPFLRSRAYQSNLGDRQLWKENPKYTSYLTSYTSDGLKINALLTIPNGEKPVSGFPAIVFVHGYVPPTDYKTTEKYVDYVDYLAKSGFIVLKIDLRGHGQSEGNPSGAYYSGDYIVDTLNARAALQTTPEANPSAIGLWGHSMAGNIVLRALAASPMIPAVVIWAGAGYTYQDLAELKVSDSSYRPLPADNEHTRGTQGLFAKWGRFDPNSDFWKTVVATNYLGDIKGAIQLNHAQNDVTVSIEYSRQLNKLLDATTIPHELYEYKIGGHNISGASFDLAMAKTVEFFTKYLK